jgi:2-(1,2-epoxy-1,2-dihydrophenyl)acetyl-CoA isomerase
MTVDETVADEHAPKEHASTEYTPNEKAPKPPAVEGGGEPLIRIEFAADTDSHVAVLTLNTPKIRNALTAEMRMALRGALKTLAADDRVHALVLTGAAGNFCAGGDVRTMGETDPHKIRQRMTEVAETAEAIARFPKPVIAAVSGHAAGAGVSLACLCDMIVADETAEFTFSFLRLALGPDWGLSWSLPRRVGATRARALILTRGPIDAVEAQHIGLVDHLAEKTALDAAITIAKEICNGPREATAAVKIMLSDLDGLHKALAAEMAMQLERFPSWEHQEGAKAFKEKRKADYTKPV